MSTPTPIDALALADRLWGTTYTEFIDSQAAQCLRAQAARIAELEAALAQQVPEPQPVNAPVAWWSRAENGNIRCWTSAHADSLRLAKETGFQLEPLYAAPVAQQVPAVPSWVPVTEAMPKSGVTVLACYRNRLGNLRRIRANWVAAKSAEANSDSDTGEYDEATDTYYDPEGWYERIDNWGDYSAVAVCEGEVTHWMPLPAAPLPAPTPEKP